MSDISEPKEHKNNTEEQQKKNKYHSQERWQKKAGYISKAYKLKQDTVIKFAEACEKVNISQASQIKKMMENFIDEVFGNSTNNED